MAHYLLASGLAHWCEGVVFLDEHDEKMILVKATGRELKLSQCGIAVDKRFAFYDQIHTTGMDIKHAINARAVLTLGKDMTFRDLAQGAFRMRGIGEGQVVSILIIPEVAELMQRQLAMAGRRGEQGEGGKDGEGAVPGHGKQAGEGRERGLVDDVGDEGWVGIGSAVEGLRVHGEACNRSEGKKLRDVSAWLVLNSMRSERVQFDQLCQQNLANIWRHNAFDQLLAGHRHFKVRQSRLIPSSASQV